MMHDQGRAGKRRRCRPPNLPSSVAPHASTSEDINEEVVCTELRCQVHFLCLGPQALEHFVPAMSLAGGRFNWGSLKKRGEGPSRFQLGLASSSLFVFLSLVVLR